ncbi:MAG TPA: 1-(5-phosphoribosyl)-5-[(5-phosphoribosylamino)methylideneamino]imidazole-4-carboxamide isomerase [Syntrophales bacterium]|nr:1-(5-phosphoribosyl)-5-[(5-phosphoribosylamino)methylideneamino]imidazole-4-carboxamide isomerase [Syntrophales bacterium]HPI58164.1 1-(5-phosphoribosyl)-5-[(5-phosphoribosylamino)methylideneamino]imidazole-4-carboxamide isomerase [Syntrophales bacterium]HPN25992.1 1-(5-phosphoribosyl)-5-[(5-phosphoribosylamino)methylideneamino]imidazole-4-carboxamide isomerase [Syntrophales bacterium]HQM30212.1 1-(5-phosphoribosyl)-5-[(5-phosphoribosylamino)methylideneamino]imidazole-4-carboxamide isomerase 
MIIIPAVDIRDGKCVRLLQGDFDKITVYSDSPVEMALRWQDKGAERIHVVDLDGSRSGSPRNRPVIEALAKALSIPVQLGGGIRNLGTVEAYLDLGVSRVILGTAAHRDRSFVEAACRKHPGRIIIGLDARDGKAAVQGWTEATDETALDIARRYEDVGVDAIVFTDIRRDGMETGVNVESTAALARSVRIPIIASGGVSGITDIERLLPVEKDGVIGVIVGKALYTGALSLEEAIHRARTARA